MTAIIRSISVDKPSAPTVREQEFPAGIGKRVEFIGLGKSYGPVKALMPINLVIEPGEFFAIIGPSGSGKTTLLGLTVGFITADDGAILIDGRNIEDVPPFKRNFGMVFQNYSLFPHKTVGENIAFPLQMRREPKAVIRDKVTEALKLVRLDGFADRYPSALSGGQQQRVALARAAVYNPPLLVMDEPLSALDKNLREEMQYEIKQLQSKLGSTVLYVTHDQSEAAAMADRIAIMNGGSIIQIGSAEELYSKPKNRFVASFLGQANIFTIGSTKTIGSRSVVTTTDGLTLKISNMLNTPDVLCACVRPEAITLSREHVAADNQATGIVTEATFTNGMRRHRVAIGDGFMIEQWQQASAKSYTPSMGDKVYLGWSADDTLAVRKD